jgi:hypothetical protein
MIVSHKHRFIFIKTTKTAGTSIEILLSQHCGDNDIVTPIKPHVEPHCARNHEGFYNHMPAHEVRDKVGADVFDSYFTFCFERNPYDKTVSHYYMFKNSPEHKWKEDLEVDEYFMAGNFCIDRDKYLPPGGGDIMVDRVCRYESLETDLSEVFDQLGIPADPSTLVRAKSGFRDERDYTKVLDHGHIGLVNSLFAYEFAQFGYPMHA